MRGDYTKCYSHSHEISFCGDGVRGVPLVPLSEGEELQDCKTEKREQTFSIVATEKSLSEVGESSEYW